MQKLVRSKYGAIALGSETKVDIDRGIALGFNSQLLRQDDANKQTYYDPKQNQSVRHTAPTNDNNRSVLSIGNSQLKRKIIHVSAGLEDTDGQCETAQSGGGAG